jgi:hypothetical protein
MFILLRRTTIAAVGGKPVAVVARDGVVKVVSRQIR